MVEWLDETVGELLGHLDEKGLTENTLVLYVSDNGWIQTADPQLWYESKSKVSPYDAGLRSPMMVRWPGHVEPSRDERTLVSSIDLAPTMLAAAGVEVPQGLPGINLTDKARLFERKQIFGALFAHTAVDVDDPVENLKYRWALREDGWKLIEPYAANEDVELMIRPWEVSWLSVEPQLYNVLDDPSETTNRIGEHPEIAESLREDLQTWWRVE